MRATKALLLPAGFVAGLVFEALAFSVSVSLPTTGCQTGADSDAGPVGAQTSVCGGSGGDDTACCIAIGGGCTYDYECCNGSCSSGACVTNASNPSCKAALGSRCPTGGCQCGTDDDCCIGGCATNTIGDADGGDLRCCLSTGQPCGSPYDCCSLNCAADTLQCQ